MKKNILKVLCPVVRCAALQILILPKLSSDLQESVRLRVVLEAGGQDGPLLLRQHRPAPVRPALARTRGLRAPRPPA